MQYVFGGPNWQINKQKNGSSLFCVCGLCGSGISFSGASNINALINYLTIKTCDKIARTKSEELGGLSICGPLRTTKGPVSAGILSFANSVKYTQQKETRLTVI